MREKRRTFYEFGPFRLDAAGGRLWREGREIQLTPKAFGVLLALVGRAGETVHKDELMREVWPDTAVEEGNLADNVSVLRQALGDDAREPRYIKTVPRRGYRFVADVIGPADGNAGLVVAEHTREHILFEEQTDPAFEPRRAVTVAPEGGVIAGAAELVAPRRARPKVRPAVLAAAASLVALAAAAYVFRATRTAPGLTGPAEIRSIAVLPFSPLKEGGGDEDTYLGLGMADALITRLGSIERLTVRPTSSVRRFAGAEQDPLAAGRALQVDAVLEGNVQQMGDRLRVTCRLLRQSDGTTLWAGKFDERFTDIFAVQDSISERAAAALAPRLTPEEKRGLSKQYTESAEAYALYLKGRYHWSTFKQDDLVTSINYYKAAIEKDPNFALAYAGLSHSYSVIGIWGPWPTREAMPKAIEAAHKAVELDDELADGHIAVGAAKMFYEWDWPGAERELLRAKQLARADSNVYTLYSYYLHAQGRAGEAAEEARRAREVAPLFHVAADDYPWALFLARRYDEAASFCERELKLDPENEDLHVVLGMVHTQQGKYEQAVAELQRGWEIEKKKNDRGSASSATQLGVAYALMGKRREALRQVAEVEKLPLSWTPFWLAEIYAALGDKDAAFASLEKGYEARCPFLWDVRAYPQFDPLREDPRYAALLRRMNLTP